METKTLEEFRKEYPSNKSFRWDLFDIVCKKCGSDKVEFNGDIYEDGGYYAGDGYVNGQIIIKCHGCGNAFVLSPGDISK